MSMPHVQQKAAASRMSSATPATRDATRGDAPLALIGIYPPPYGGVSVSLQRLIPYLDASGLDYVVYNTGPSRTSHPRIRDIGWSLKWMLRMLLFCRHQVMQFSTSRWPVRAFAALVRCLRDTRLIIYARGYGLPNSFYHGNWAQRRIVRWTLGRTDRVFAPNPDLRERIASIGYDRERIETIPPFIPPDQPPRAEEIPDEVRRFCAGKHPVLVANGAFVKVNGQDVYGLRAMAELVQALLPSFPQLAVVVYLRSGANHAADDFADFVAQVRQAPLCDHLLLFDSKGDFLPILSIADAFLRPSTTDGDANSIREALHFGVPVIASSVIPRPEGCRLYEVNSPEGFHTAVRQVLENLEAERALAAAAPKYNAADKLIAIYREMLAAD